MPRPSEDDLIARWLKPLATDPAALGLTDDCARLAAPAGEDLILKVDAVAEGIHFFPDDPWDAVARKALRVNLSDLAAKGARPLGYLLALGLPAEWTESQMDALAAGLADDQREFGLSLLGGDTIRAPAGLILSVTVLGAVPAGQGPSRAAAQAGDLLYISGTVGDAALGLRLRREAGLAARLGLDSAAAAHLLDRYLLPRPRLALGPAVRAHANGAMDVSDGLLIDLSRLCRAAGLAARLDTAAVPLSPAAARAVESDSELLEIVLTGGDDYEILATIPEASAAAFERDARAAGIPVARIGTLATAGDGPPIRLSDGRPLAPVALGYRHF